MLGRLSVTFWVMENACLAEIVAILVLSFSLQVHVINVDQTFIYGCSNYTFMAFTTKIGNWEESRRLCKKFGSDLVSIESNKEWNILTSAIQNHAAIEYFIGLKKDTESEDWIWVSNNKSMNASWGKHPWAPGQPSKDGDCAVMYKDYNHHYGLYNDLKCGTKLKNSGYICERPVGCIDNKEPVTQPVTSPTKDRNKPTSSKITTAQTLLVTSVIHSTPPTQKQSTKSMSTITTREQTRKSTTFQKKTARRSSTIHSLSSTSEVHSTLSTRKQTDYNTSTTSTKATLPGNTVDEVAVEATKSSSNLIVIVLILLAVIILVIVIIFWVVFVRRRQSNKRKASICRERSSDHEHCLESSTELTVHFRTSRPEEGLGTFNKSKEEDTYAVVDKGKRKPRCEQRGSPTHEQGEGKQARPVDGNLTEVEVAERLKHSEAKCKDKEKRKDCVYAVVHIAPVGSKATAVCKDPAVQEGSLNALCPPHDSPVDESSVELVSLEHGKEMTNSQSAAQQNPNGGYECGEFLYAVVDKASKKQRPLQMPSSHRELMYADMSHLPKKKAGKINRAYVPTVYADINHLKTDLDGAKSMLQKANEDETMENNNDL